MRKQVCGFANSHEGGFLMLGARWDSGDQEWRLDGVAFEGEPILWISDVVRNSVRPRPSFDITAWAVDDGRHVAVVKIEPTPTPPCNTNGVVYERVSGATVPVREPQRLAALFKRGDLAREAAETLALTAAVQILGDGRELDGYADSQLHFALGPSRPPGRAGQGAAHASQFSSSPPWARWLSRRLPRRRR